MTHQEIINELKAIDDEAPRRYYAAMDALALEKVKNINALQDKCGALGHIVKTGQPSMKDPLGENPGTGRCVVCGASAEVFTR